MPILTRGIYPAVIKASWNSPIEWLFSLKSAWVHHWTDRLFILETRSCHSRFRKPSPALWVWNLGLKTVCLTLLIVMVITSNEAFISMASSNELNIMSLKMNYLFFKFEGITIFFLYSYCCHYYRCPHLYIGCYRISVSIAPTWLLRSIAMY